MLVLFPGWVSRRHHFSQIVSGGERLLGATTDHGGSNAPGEPFFTVFLQNTGNVLLGSLVNKVCRSLTSGVVHAHVQRALVLKAETAAAIIKLRTGDTQIQQHPGQTRAGVLQITKTFPNKR